MLPPGYFPFFLGLLLKFFKQKLQCLAPICIGPQCVKVGNTLKAYHRITLSVSPSRIGLFNVPNLLQLPEAHCKLVISVSENSPTGRHCIAVQASLPIGWRSSSPLNAWFLYIFFFARSIYWVFRWRAVLSGILWSSFTIAASSCTQKLFNADCK